jgi:hypothetical protein
MLFVAAGITFSVILTGASVWCGHIQHREYLHTFQKGNEQAINIIFIQFYFK